jgi:hypothetical protein
MAGFPMGVFHGFFRIEPNRAGANSILFREEPHAWAGHHQSHQRAASLRLVQQTHRMDATDQGDQCFTKCPEDRVVPYAGGHGRRDHSRANCAQAAKTFRCCSKEGGAKACFWSNERCQAKVKSFIDHYGEARRPILSTKICCTITLSAWDGGTA